VKEEKIEVEGQKVEKSVLMGPSTEDVVDQFQVEIKYSTQSRSYENGMKVILEQLESNFPGLSVTPSKVTDKEKFDIMLKQKGDDKELIVYSKQILGDSLPTKRNSARFDDKFNKALIEMKQIECTMNKLEEVSKDASGFPVASEIRERTEIAPADDLTLVPVIAGEKAITETDKVPALPVDPEAIQGPLQPGTHQEIVNEVKEVDQNPIA